MQECRPGAAFAHGAPVAEGLAVGLNGAVIRWVRRGAVVQPRSWSRKNDGSATARRATRSSMTKLISASHTRSSVRAS